MNTSALRQIPKKEKKKRPEPKRMYAGYAGGGYVSALRRYSRGH